MVRRSARGAPTNLRGGSVVEYAFMGMTRTHRITAGSWTRCSRRSRSYISWARRPVGISPSSRHSSWGGTRSAYRFSLPSERSWGPRLKMCPTPICTSRVQSMGASGIISRCVPRRLYWRLAISHTTSSSMRSSQRVTQGLPPRSWKQNLCNPSFF